MKRAIHTIRALALVLLVCVLLTTAVFAAEKDGAWLHVMPSDADQTTTAVIAADTVITDGLVELTYDSTVLTYKGLTVDDDCVAMYAVNADEPGVIKISWVAPKEYRIYGSASWLMKVQFTGVSSDIAITGELFTGKGAAMTPDTLDTAALRAAVEAAQSLNEKDYTSRSYNAVKSAMKSAQKVLADPEATQKDVDKAAATLASALDSLEVKKPSGGNKPGKPNEPTQPTEPEQPGKPGCGGISDLIDLILDLLLGILNTGKEGMLK